MDYKEKLEEAKRLYETANVDQKYVLESLFPELKESEGVRIRKEIIKYLEQTVPHHHRDEVLKSKEWIAWLKKQGEQKSIDNLSQQEAMDIAVAKCFEQGEQKPIEEHDFLKIASNSYSLSFINYLDAHLYEGKMCVSNGECEDIENAFRNADWGKIGRYYNKFTQKPVESEPFEIEHGKYYYCIQDYYSGGNKRASKGDVVQALRGMSMMALGVKANEYFIPVKCIVDVKPVLSEENEEMLDFAIRAVGLCKQYAINHQVNGYSNLPDVPKKYEELQDWLKSIRRQKQWKPSEEQMGALRDVISGCSYDIEPLVELETKLKEM